MELAWLNKIYTCSFVAKSRHAGFISINFTYFIDILLLKSSD
ncbi:hypothetical protein SAMN05444380_105117 [Thermophagus xiamenensis]|uniref:Uncharacterized protein n=1 Tax=Thermophagus xiamenensis TaxID=385682 RepID=A0A1I1X7D2_9BACT|nr:hypothetical protein SAMN05444380_105117 [Thermophagus xiamenensis]